MAKLRSVSTAFWSDPFIEELTPNEKLLFLYLVTNEKTNMLGIYEASERKMAFETGLTKEEVRNALKGFERLSKVKYINNYVILSNFMKHQNFNTNMKKSAIDIYNNLPKELKDSNLTVDRLKPLEGFETLLNHFGMVRKREVEIETEYEIEEEEEEEDKSITIEKPKKVLSTEEVSIPKKKDYKEFSLEVKSCYKNLLPYFTENLRPKNKKIQENWLDTVDKLNRIDKIAFKTIEDIVKKARGDSFTAGYFLSLPKLRKNNSDGLKYIIAFNEKFNKNENQSSRTNEEIFNQAMDSEAARNFSY